VTRAFARPSPTVIDRLLSLSHTGRIEQIETVLAALGKGIVVGVREVAGRGAFIALLNPLVGLITHSRIPCLFQRPGVALHAQCEQDGPLDRLHHFIGNTAQ
jgi:hypothetical protein